MGESSYSRITIVTVPRKQGAPLEPKLEPSPRLRFLDENGQSYPEWEEKRLGEVSERITRKNTLQEKRNLTISSTFGLVDQMEFFSKQIAAKDNSHYILLKNGEYAYNKSTSKDAPYGAVRRLEKYSQGAVSTLYICFKTHLDYVDSSFFKHLSISSSWLDGNIPKIATEGARNHGLLNVAPTDFFSLPLPLPSLPEQEKIGEFLSSLDTEVEQAERLVSLLSDRKKAYAQRIFDRTLRFHDDNDNPYPEWEEKKLGDFLTTADDKPAVSVDTQRLLTVGLWGKGVSLSTKGQGFKEGATQFYIRRPGQLIYGKQNLYKGAIDLLSDDFNTTYSSKDSPAFNFKGILVDKSFVLHYLLRENYYKSLEKHASGTGSKRVGESTFLGLSIPLPSLPEQEKIGSFLSALDDEIDEAKRELGLLKERKKAYAQKIFGV